MFRKYKKVVGISIETYCTLMEVWIWKDYLNRQDIYHRTSFLIFCKVSHRVSHVVDNYRFTILLSLVCVFVV